MHQAVVLCRGLICGSVQQAEASNAIRSHSKFVLATAMRNGLTTDHGGRSKADKGQELHTF
jgi:hypothetical protein